MSETDGLSAEDLPILTEEVKQSSVSEMLVQARQARNLSQQDVANKLFLSVSYIKYIDEGTLHQIPKPAFIRGYLRSYARLVGVSGDEVVRCFDSAGSSNEREPGSVRNVTEEQVGPTKFTGPVAQTGFVGLAGVGVLIFLVWWLTPPEEDGSAGSLELAEQSVVSSVEEDVTAVGPLSAVLSESSERGTLQEAAELTPDPPIKSSQPSVSGAQEQPTPVAGDAEEVLSSTLEDEAAGVAERSNVTSSIEQSTSEQTTVQTAEQDTAVELPAHGDASIALQSETEVTFDRYQEGEYKITKIQAGGEDHLRFTFVDECWLEVKDAGGSEIYGDLNHANDIVHISGQAPFKILIGRAQSVTLLFNDQPFNLVPHSINDTTKLVIGN